MRTELIENKHTNNNFSTLLREALAVADSIELAVAFLSYSGLKEGGILNFIKNKEKRVRVLTSTRDGITEPKALRKLIKRKNVELRLSLDNNFHSKLYIITTRKGKIIFIGSSNLTKNGLSADGELNIMVKCKKEDFFLKECENKFEQWWETSKHTEIVQCVKSYEQYYLSNKKDAESASSKRTQLLWKKHKKILGVKRVKRTPVVLGRKITLKNRPLFQVTFSGRLKKATVDMIKQDRQGSVWERKDWPYFGSSTRDFYGIIRPGDYLLVYDTKKSQNWLYLHRLIASMHRKRIKNRTGEGPYFYAYTKNNKWKKISSDWRKNGVTKNYLENAGYRIIKQKTKLNFFKGLFKIN